jgi:2,3-bisphosphoglycerate-independent phosphoglycerate mutase
VRPLEKLLGKIRSKNDRDYRIASGGGRMLVTMDRYFADWSIVERGYNAHVHGKGRAFASAEEAIRTYYDADPEVIDQFLPEFVIHEDGRPVGPVRDGDAVVFFNFRGDRAIEISMAFENDAFDGFDRGARPDVFYAGMMQYDGDLLLPEKYLVEPPEIDRTVSEYLARAGVRQLAVSETQKFGHVTYFWNGNRSGKFDEELETYIEIPSDRIPFQKKPEMKAAEITDAVIREMRTGRYPFIRLNFANGDMVGHTGVLDAAVKAVETVDESLGRLLAAVKEMKGVAFVTADHGNSDEMFEKDRKTGAIKVNGEGRKVVRTSHTLNPVPFTVVGPPPFDRIAFDASIEKPMLSHIAATILLVLGYERPEGYDPPLFNLRDR